MDGSDPQGEGSMGVHMRTLPDADPGIPKGGVACLFHSWVCPLDLQDRVTGKARTVERPRR